MFNLFRKKPKPYQNITADTFAELSEKKDHVILDVRSPNELSEGSIPGHIMINFFESDFKEELNKLDKSKSYLVYCRSGNRSGKACSLMAKIGFNKLYNLKGGIGAWNTLKAVS